MTLWWQPTPVFLPGESHGWRSLVDYSPWGCKESDMTEQLHFTSWHYDSFFTLKHLTQCLHRVLEYLYMEFLSLNTSFQWWNRLFCSVDNSGNLFSTQEFQILFLEYFQLYMFLRFSVCINIFYVLICMSWILFGIYRCLIIFTHWLLPC